MPSSGANIISPGLCFTLGIPGDWHPAEEPGTYRSFDGKQFVEVLPLTARDVKRGKGNTLPEKEASILVQIHEKAFRQKLTDTKLEPFESSVPGTWKWSASRPPGSESFDYPKRYLIDLSPDGIIVINIQRSPDDDALARGAIATLKRPEERPCQLRRTVNEILASAGIQTGDSAKTIPPLITYNSAPYGWSLSYPRGWKVDTTPSTSSC